MTNMRIVFGMAKAFSKKVEALIRNESTIEFVNEALKSGNSRFLGIKNESDLVDSRQKSGTWISKIFFSESMFRGNNPLNVPSNFRKSWMN